MSRPRPYRVWALDRAEATAGTVLRGAYASRKAAARAALALQRAHSTVPIVHYTIGDADGPHSLLPGELVRLAGEAAE